MQSIRSCGARSYPSLAVMIGVLLALPLTAAHAAEGAIDVSGRAVSADALHTWHENLRAFPPLAEGCFHAAYPSLVWEAEACAAPTTYRSAPPRGAHALDASDADGASGDTVGNGYDYAAQTANLTSSALGTFPTVTGVTSASTTSYTLQLNTNFGPSPTFCANHGYTNCQTWEQFIYSSNYPGNAGTGVSGAQAFIQNWIFLTKSNYQKKHCPSGWNSYAAQYACYKNSAGVAASAVTLANLASVKLAGSASTGGLDTVTFTYGTTAKAVSQSGSTVDIGATWDQSEFNVVGNGGGSGASFNTGSTLHVSLVVNSGTTNAPTCLGPTNAGFTGETNNLNLGACTASGGTSPKITFVESN